MTAPVAPAADIDHGLTPIEASGDPSTEQPAPSLFVLSVDELRALSRLTDLVLPVFVTDGDQRLEEVDVAALRGLAARDLVALTEDGLGFAVDGELSAVLAPCHDARVVAEVDHDDGADTTSWSVLGSDTAPSTVVTERSPGIVILALEPADVTDVVVSRCEAHAVNTESAGTGFTVPAGLHETANDAIDRGDTDEAVDILLGAGAGFDAAAAFVHAVSNRRGAVAVQVARNVGVGDEGPFEAGEVRWIVGPAGDAWRMTVELSDDDTDDRTGDSDDDGLDGDDAFEARMAAAIAPLARHDLIEALNDVLAPASPDQPPEEW